MGCSRTAPDSRRADMSLGTEVGKSATHTRKPVGKDDQMAAGGRGPDSVPGFWLQ